MTEIFWQGIPRQTKIIATLGPSTGSEEVIARLVDAGIDAVRLNFSHGNRNDHIRYAEIVRSVCKAKRYHIAILGDLQGPKIRIQKFKDAETRLEKGQTFRLLPQLDEGDNECVGITYSDLYRDVKVDDELLLDDGRITLKVLSSGENEIFTEVLVGGILSNNKGINRRGGGLSAPSITEKDKDDLILAAEIGVDYLAVSFPKSADDIVYARKLLNDAGNNAQVIAKIERVDALKNIDQILEVSDGVMIARGDLSIEIGDATLTAVQKHLIKKARKYNRIVITATEMLQSMIDSNVPTRAEISDVANAVLDGSDALMLSAESAIGKYPVEAVEAMGRLCHGAESAEVGEYRKEHFPEEKLATVEKAVAAFAVYTATSLDAKAIAALTESGAIALYMSRYLSAIPIYAMTPNVDTCRKITLYRNVYPLLIDSDHRLPSVNDEVVHGLRMYRAVESGDKVVVTKGDRVGVRGGTNGAKVITVP